MTSSSSSSPLHLQALHEQGFVLVRSLLSPAEVAVLREACETATAQARAGSWPFIRTLPKQFPPWPSKPPAEGIWGVQHLLHPDMPGHAAFAGSYFNPSLLAVVQEVLGVHAPVPSGSSSHGVNGANGTNGTNGTSGMNGVSYDDGDTPAEEPLVMELYNLLVRPESDFELRWHRDDVPPTATAAEEEAALNVGPGRSKPPVYSHTQWNLALYPDDSLIVVPGTHRRARNAAERAAGPHDPLPGQLAVHLEPGDAVFYDNDILHRGKYDSRRERATLHGSVGKKGFTEKRARNVLQHGVGDWIAGCSFEVLQGQQRARAEAMKANLLRMGTGSGIGFSQSD